MTYEVFWMLHAKLQPGILESLKLWRRKTIASFGRTKRRNLSPPVPNGAITSSVRLACALRYFAGGSPYDLMCKYGISYVEVMRSVWTVVEAVNTLPEFHITYPSEHATQQKIADEFRSVSGVQFDNCAGAIDGLLIWITKPSEKDAERAGVLEKNWFALARESLV